ncbi:uncharacterized protein I303_101058 [Kwoniella dejecticola CBS 10117]|uniref:Uncharacterized protein n=1 Tax=Kwoniella dejecticola CBS 10117 TaxID=1296121 RepID=A0A1A6AGP7_9TREE|nr:uncharacterized protein I303_01061 [Kwoniella dejecticola CBS 10117]OBR89236.1 hypothetical protein I303_01061 [Kwoniella dejecticola CBS 10117]
MPKWKTDLDAEPSVSQEKEEQQEGNEVSNGKGKGKSGNSKASSRTSKKTNTSTSGKSTTSRQRKAKTSDQPSTIDDGEQAGKKTNRSQEGPRKGVFAMLDAMVPTQEASSSKIPDGTLTFSKKPTPARKSRSSSSKKGKPTAQQHQPEIDNGEYNYLGLWVQRPSPIPEPKKPPKTETIDDNEIDELDGDSDHETNDQSRVTPKSNSKRRRNRKAVEPPSSPSPPPTKLITPAAAGPSVNLKVTDSTPVFPQPESELGPRHRYDPQFLSEQAGNRKQAPARTKNNRQMPRTLEEALQNPFTPVLSPDSDDEIPIDDESPSKRVAERRHQQREEPARLSTTDEDDESRKIPPPSFLSRRAEAERVRTAQEQLEREQTAARNESRRIGLDNDILVPSSDIENSQPQQIRHFGIGITPFANGVYTESTKGRSKSTSRKTKTYGNGRSHAYQHGHPLPLAARSQSVALSPPPQIQSSYRGAKRKGSTTFWRDPSFSPDAVDAFEPLQQGESELDSDHVPLRKKRNTYARNGPAPDERILGLFEEDENEPPRYRRKRGKTPRVPVTRAFRYRDSEDEGYDSAQEHLEREKRRRKRRKSAIVKRHRFETEGHPQLHLTQATACQYRVDEYARKVAQILPTPKKPLKASTAARQRSYKRTLGDPRYSSKPISTISFSEYKAKYRPPLAPISESNSPSTRSRPSHKDKMGGRVEELISAGRKARLEQAIRKQRSVTRDFTPKLPLKALDPSQEDPQKIDQIDVEHARPHRNKAQHLGSSGIPHAKYRLPFTSKDKEYPSTNTNTSRSENSSNSVPTAPIADIEVLGHIMYQPPSKVNRKKPMPPSFRPPTSQQVDRDDESVDDSPVLQNDRPTQPDGDDPIMAFSQFANSQNHHNQNPQAYPDQQQIPEATYQNAGFTEELPARAEIDPFEIVNQLYAQDVGKYQMRPQIEAQSPKYSVAQNIHLPQLGQNTVTPSTSQRRPPTHVSQGGDPDSKKLPPSGLDAGLDMAEDDTIVRLLGGSQPDWTGAQEWFDPTQMVESRDDPASGRVQRANRQSAQLQSRNEPLISSASGNITHLQEVDPAITCEKEDRIDQRPSQDTQKNPTNPQQRSVHKQMSGMDMLQHLLDIPIDPAIVRNVNNTFVRQKGDGRAKSTPNRQSRLAERAKRVQERHSRRRREAERRPAANEPLIFPILPVQEPESLSLPQQEDIQDEQVEEAPHDIQPPKLTLREAYRNIHPQHSDDPISRSRTSAPARFSLANQPVVKHFSEARQPSIKRLEERNNRASQEAVQRLFRPPVGGIESDTPGEVGSAVYESTEVDPDTQLPRISQLTESRRSSRSRKNSAANRFRSENTADEYVDAWREEIRPDSGRKFISQKTDVDWDWFEGNLQGGNPFENDLRVFQGASSPPPEGDAPLSSGYERGQGGQSGKRRSSSDGRDWVGRG